jgi:hypothetical protein
MTYFYFYSSFRKKNTTLPYLNQYNQQNSMSFATTNAPNDSQLRALKLSVGEKKFSSDITFPSSILITTCVSYFPGFLF